MARRRGSDRRNGNSPPGRLRIVAGKWRSRLLKVDDIPGLRPTPERIRETLFNWLSPDIEGSRCLDLFAGSGALGLEALSRGAASVEFVEKSRRAMTSLQNACNELGAEGASLLPMDAFAYLGRRPDRAFHVVFLDPPYADDSVAELCRLLDDGDWLVPGATVYFEQQKTQSPPDLPEGWSITHQKEAGQVRYSLATTATLPKES
jgi:16S rRNA (guanine966-N2)-methyltransferase